MATSNASIGNADFKIGYNTPGPTKFSSIDDVVNQLHFQSASDPNLNDKLSQQSFTSVQQVIDYLTKYDAAQAASSKFIAATTANIATLGKTSGSLTDALANINSQFNTVISAGQAIIDSGDLSSAQLSQMTDAENMLTAARDKALQAATDVATAQDTAAQNTLTGRYLSASASISGTSSADAAAKLFSFDTGVQPQRDAYKAQLVGVYGDAFTATQQYADDMANLEKTLGEERLSIVTSYNQQIIAQQAALVQTNVAIAGRYTAAASIVGGTSQSPYTQENQALTTFDNGEQSQRDALSKQLTDLYGASYTATASYADEMTGLEKTLGEERLAIVKQYGDQILAAQDAINQTDTSLYVRLSNATATVSNDPTQIQNAKLYAFDQDANAQRTALSTSLTNLYGPAIVTTQGYALQMQLLEKTLGEERLATQTQYNQQIIVAQNQAASAATT